MNAESEKHFINKYRCNIHAVKSKFAGQLGRKKKKLIIHFGVMPK